MDPAYATMDPATLYQLDNGLRMAVPNYPPSWRRMGLGGLGIVGPLPPIPAPVEGADLIPSYLIPDLPPLDAVPTATIFGAPTMYTATTTTAPTDAITNLLGGLSLPTLAVIGGLAYLALRGGRRYARRRKIGRRLRER